MEKGSKSKPWELPYSLENQAAFATLEHQGYCVILSVGGELGSWEAGVRRVCFVGDVLELKLKGAERIHRVELVAMQSESDRETMFIFKRVFKKYV